MTRRPFIAFIVCCALQSKLASIEAQAPGWDLLQGDRVVFYGDSITEQRFYTWWVELYAVTRFPKQHVLFSNAGVGGDRVTGGGGGSIDTRLQRDVFAHEPSMVTVMLGMNDGGYAPLTPATESTYVQGYRHILSCIAARAPRARVLAIGPSAYDDVTRPPTFPGGYNATLISLGRDAQRLATEFSYAYTDANAPFVQALSRAGAINNAAAQLLVPDRVHPEISAHLIIAAAVLDGWHAPPLVASTALDAATKAVLPATRRAHVSSIKSGEREFAWDSLEEALPLPLGYGHAGYTLVKQVTEFTARFNEEPLTVRNLAAGTYALRIDGVEVGRYTSAQLSDGLNLAEEDTPMRRQSQSVEWIIRDKGDLQYVRSRIAIANSSPAAGPALDTAEKQMQEKIWHDATPVAHHFLLTRVAP